LYSRPQQGSQATGSLETRLPNRLAGNAVSSKAAFDAQAVTLSKVTLPDGTVLKAR